ncbi:MAG: phosphoadenylyl-sulfate reductase [Bacteroidales bacterium]|nr:phosphoadenylyl-sulfate reductase [Bacteroidales bacterium]
MTNETLHLPATVAEREAMADELNRRFADGSPEALLRYMTEAFRGRIALSSSLSLEDQVLTDMLCGIDKQTRVFTLDTGRMFPETYNLIDRTNERYGIQIEVFFPDFQKVEEMVRTHGINLFYSSVELRHLCCNTRKIEPLHRALRGLDVWVCGLRRAQSPTRTSMRMVEYDAADGMLKLNPIIEWSEAQTRAYVKEHAVPYNKLHDRGFPSIGCQPCTRAVEAGEDIRSGRWWWEDPNHRECGLHSR